MSFTPLFIRPCLASPATEVPTGPQWAYEIKHDGYRFIVRKDGNRVFAFTRNGHDWTSRVPGIAEAAAKLPVKTATIDGEYVIVDETGVSNFEELRAGLARNRAPEAFL